MSHNRINGDRWRSAIDSMIVLSIASHIITTWIYSMTYSHRKLINGKGVTSFNNIFLTHKLTFVHLWYQGLNLIKRLTIYDSFHVFTTMSVTITFIATVTDFISMQRHKSYCQFTSVRYWTIHKLYWAIHKLRSGIFIVNIIIVQFIA